MAHSPSVRRRVASMNELVERVCIAVRRDLPPVQVSTAQEWSRPLAVRVIDCVLSLNRNYNYFVVPRLDRFTARYPDIESVRDLCSLLDRAGPPERFVADALDYRDPNRAYILDAVAKYVLREVIRSADAQSEPRVLAAWAAAASPSDHTQLHIHGFALAGFQYLRMLFGANTCKPDVHICNFVEQVIGRRMAPAAVCSLIEDVARAEQLNARDLDIAIWTHMSSKGVVRPKSQPAGSTWCANRS